MTDSGQMESDTFWTTNLKKARYVLAPMVDQSELPWRMLSRRYGAELCYTPMLHASVFIKDTRYRKENLTSCPEDRPLIVQFCANDAETLLEAARLAEDHCEAVDLNLGCPQAIAKRGNYGAFLENDWDLLYTMVNRVHKELKVPITCKIRIFEDIHKTIRYAKMLESAGCKLLAVHGRTKEQKGSLTGLASWAHIKAVKDNVKIPVFANGNVQCLQDVEKCIKQTGVDGVMIAEGNLHNPALFHGISPPVWQVATEYLKLVEVYPCSMSCVRGHMFKLCHHCLVMEENKDLRQTFACAKTIKEFFEAVENLKQRCQDGKFANWRTSTAKELPYPPWICQAYVRPPFKPQENSNVMQQHKRSPSDSTEILISKKKLKKMKKNPNKIMKIKEKKVFQKCVVCHNPRGSKCTFDMCKVCCKTKTSKDILNCCGHKFLYLTKHNSLLTAQNSLQTKKQEM